MYQLPIEQLPDMGEHEALLRRCTGIVHGVFAWIFCIVIGHGVWPHVRVMWHRSVDFHWAFGFANLGLFAILMLSGLALLYGTEAAHMDVSAVHFWLGFLCPVPYLVHTWRQLSLR